MPADNQYLRQTLAACIPSLVIDGVAKESGQRVVYYGHFDDTLIPDDLPADSDFLRGWAAWGCVVVKVVSGIDTTSLTYLQREIEILKGIDSPCFPKLRFSDVFSTNPVSDDLLAERLYVTIEERIDSVPLSSVTQNYGTEAAVANLLLRLCEALSVLWNHKKRLVHRDIKPDNILVRPNGDIVVIDLGIVRETGTAGVTLTAAPWGPMTPAFAAPEQCTNDKDAISFKTDFFALGIIAYQLLSGANPFSANANTPFPEIMANVLNTVPPALSKLGLASPEFSAIVEQLLEKQPYRRFRTSEQLVGALKAIMEAV